MSTPRLEINLDKIHHNACVLVERLALRGISVTGITKATIGSPEIANTLLNAGIHSLGDSRIENIKKMRRAGVTAKLLLIRSPMLSQVKCVVANADISFNSEIEVIRCLSAEAKKLKRTHGIVLMVELGDLREGIMPCDLASTIRELLSLPNLIFKGIGTNLACRSGIAPDDINMAELSSLADDIEREFDLTLDIVSGGNSANINWALCCKDTGRINNLRLGESILLGCEPLERNPIEGLYTDAMSLVAEVIESKVKPSKPWGQVGQTAFGQKALPVIERGNLNQAILAVGEQDTDTEGLKAPNGIEILGASSDHLVVNTGEYQQPVGSNICFQVNYSAMLRAMTSPFIKKVMTSRKHIFNAVCI
jgi:predicted amino acid racemase